MTTEGEKEQRGREEGQRVRPQPTTGQEWHFQHAAL